MSNHCPIPFRVFWKEVFGKIGDKKKNTLFYWSLFDPSSWEEIEHPNHLPSLARSKGKVLKILRVSPTIKRLLTQDRDSFYKNFVQSEFLANYLLAAQVRARMGRKLSGKIDIANIEETVFPDIIIRGMRVGRVNIEIKGTVSAKNLLERTSNEVIVQLKKNKRDYKKFLLLLIFPACRGETGERIEELIGGYYVYEKLIDQQGLRGLKRQVLCRCIQEGGNKFTLNALVKKVVNYIGSGI